MVAEHYLVGLQMDVSYRNFKVSLTLLSATQLTFEIKEGRTSTAAKSFHSLRCRVVNSCE